jgi:hypothetical protein
MTTARDIVVRALGELNYFPEGEDPTAGSVRDGLIALNAMIASWQTESMQIFFPSATTYKGDWAERIVYSVGDSVARTGTLYTCIVAHTSSVNDRPGVAINQATYWTAYVPTELELTTTFPFPAQFERGMTSMLAVEMSPMFGVEPSAFTEKRASEGKTALLAAYMPINPVRVDNGLIRMPSQIWPYNVDVIQS